MRGTVIGRAGKAFSKYKECYNIKNNDTPFQWVDLARGVFDSSIIDDDTEMLIVSNL